MELTATSLSTDMGSGPISAFVDLSTRKACLVAGSVPTELYHNLVIQKATNEALRSWDEEASEVPHGLPAMSVGHGIIQGAEKRFLDLSKQLWGHLSLANRLQFLASQLRLQCLFMLYNTHNEARTSGILRAYSTATDLINTVLSEVDAQQALPCAPSLFARHIFSAALVIVRVLHSTSGIGLDYDRGHILFNAAAFSLSQLSAQQSHKDQAARTSDMLRLFWSAAERSVTMRQSDLRLRVRSRMGASLVYDCLMSFRHATRHEFAESTTRPSDPNRAAFSTEQGGTPGPALDTEVYGFDNLQFTSDVDLTNMFLFDDIGYPSTPQGDM